MFQMVLLALLLQGPKNLQLDENAKLKPPLVVPVGTAIPVALINSLSTLLRALFIPSDGAVHSTIDPITSSPMVSSVGTFSTVPVAAADAMASGVGSSCPDAITSGAASVSLCGSVAAVTSVADWSMVRSAMLGIIGFTVAVAVWRRITDRLES